VTLLRQSIEGNDPFFTETTKEVAMKKQKMPSLFVSHGSPMLALDKKGGLEYRQWGGKLTNEYQPKAILVFSAHWEDEKLLFGESINHDELFYDFYGFPSELYQVQYPAPSASEIVTSIENLLEKSVPKTERKLDHGVWVPFLHMWPNADLPILQMSMPNTMSNEELYNLGKSLTPLREENILIVGAGTLTHNLREGLSGKYNTTPDWTVEFDNWVETTLMNSRDDLLNWEKAPHAYRNHPSPEHFRPLLIAAGAANESDEVSFPTIGFDFTLFSKRSIQFG